ncbi:MAG: hypothetical protein IJ447_05765 [Clostridia bacterium]|nr:hypothetical protein [Clostridia bacterium]
MKKIVAFLLVLSTFFLCGCSVDDNIFEFLNRKLVVEPLVEDGLFYKFPPAQTGVEAVLDESVEQPFGITDIIINGQKYTDAAQDVSENAKWIKPIANYSDEFTFYEFETDSGVYVIADNINLQIFVKPEDKEKFTAYYDDLSNYIFMCLDEKYNLVGTNLDNQMLKTLVKENRWVHEGGHYDISEYSALKDYQTVLIEDFDGMYPIIATSKDWLVDGNYQSYLYQKDGVFYSSLYDSAYDGYPAEAVELSNEYQQYFRKMLHS